MEQQNVVAKLSTNNFLDEKRKHNKLCFNKISFSCYLYTTLEAESSSFRPLHTLSSPSHLRNHRDLSLIYPPNQSPIICGRSGPLENTSTQLISNHIQAWCIAKHEHVNSKKENGLPLNMTVLKVLYRWFVIYVKSLQVFGQYIY